jgi:hypothetical protein
MTRRIRLHFLPKYLTAQATRHTLSVHWYEEAVQKGCQMPFWVNFGGTCNEYFMAFWSILRPFGIFCGLLVYFMVIRYVSWLFGIFHPV